MGQIEGALGPYVNAGAPVSGTNEVQTITPSATVASGTFKLKFEGFETAALARNVSAANMQTALNGLPSIGSGGVAVALADGVYTITFSGANVAKRAQPLITVVENTVLDSSEDAVDLVVAESVAGVTATCLGAGKGALLIDTTNGTLYQNTGTAAAPTWSQVPSSGTLLVNGVAAGYKIARGTVAVGAASKDVDTGLATVVAAVVSLQSDPTLTHQYSTVTVGDQAGTPAAGHIVINSWKPTAANDVTPTAATTPWGTVNWIAVGTGA